MGPDMFGKCEDMSGFSGERLALQRKAKGLTQVEVAARIGYSKKQISDWETGRATPEGAAMGSLADVLGVSIDYLWQRVNEPEGTKGTTLSAEQQQVLDAFEVLNAAAYVRLFSQRMTRMIDSLSQVARQTFREKLADMVQSVTAKEDQE